MVNTYQPISNTALEILSLMRDQAEYDQVTISSTAIGNALSVKRETAARNMRALVDMNLLEVIVPQRGALAATYRIPAAAAGLLDALNGAKKPVAKRLDEEEVIYAPADGQITLKEGRWDIASDSHPPLTVRACGNAEVIATGAFPVLASESARVTAYGAVEVCASGFAFVLSYGARVALHGRSVGVSPVGGHVTATGSATAYVGGTTVLEAYDNTTWHASDTAVVSAGGRARGTLTGRATATLAREATAKASWYASVLLCDDAIADGGEQAREEDVSTPTGVLELYGASRHGKGRLYKVLPRDRMSGRFFNKPTVWDLDTDVECDEWKPSSAYDGGLFLYATLVHAIAAAARGPENVILAVEADPVDVASVGDGVVKARRVHVAEEVMWRW